MNKLMLSAAAVALTLAASPAFAADDSGVKLNLGGHFKGYINYSDEDTARHTDMLRDTEVHFGGETTLDNGLTVGAHIETTADGADSFDVDESYVYFAGSWGRVNVGKEDGAAYLLQVAAPSADDNIDGIRQSINPIGFVSDFVGAPTTVDYANDLSRSGDKVTYLSPIFSGFQAGASYTAQNDAAGSGGNRPTTSNEGITEGAVRYEGNVANVGMILGAGYTSTTEGEREWNLGADFDIGAFGVGAVYTKDKLEDVGHIDTWVLGVDYTTGPFKLGASYLSADGDIFGGVATAEVDRVAAGVVYTYGPGMSFRGSIGYADGEASVGALTGDADATTVTVGTQINF